MRSRIIAALSLSLVACSALATFDGLVGPGESTDGGTAADGAKVVDGSVAPMVDGSVDNTTDGSSFDAGTASDSPSTPDGTVFGYCPNHTGHTFCDDFDPTNSLGARWTTNVNLGSAGVGTTEYVSPPREMIATSPANDGGFEGEDDIQKPFAATASADIEAAIKVTQTAQDTDFIAIQFTPTDTSVYKDCYFDVTHDLTTGTTLEASCDLSDGGVNGYYSSADIVGAAPNWDRVHLGVSLTTNQATGSMAGTMKTVSFPAGLSTTTFKTYLGVVYKATGPGNAVVRVDDVFVDTH